ncbi:MAG: CehA/McbA family metallohydrolase [Clostridia bacterium]|nr:CehA/McbA family metallohydrolase [Clostridia bacterium]
MKKNKLISSVALLLAILTLASCTVPGIDPIESNDPALSVTTNGSNFPDTTSGVLEPVIPEGILLAGPNIAANCTIVYPSGNSDIYKAAAGYRDYILEITGVKLALCNELEAPQTEYIITISLPDSSLSCEYSVILDGKTLTVSGKDSKKIVDGLSYLKATTVKDGYLAIPENLSFTSGKAPEVLSQYPEKYYYYEDVYTPTLIYEFKSGAVDTSKSQLIINGTDMTSKAKWEADHVSLTDVTFPAGDYTVLVSLSDSAGNVKVLDTAFSCGDGSEMNLYSGELHAHTGDSDGVQTVKDAYAYARDVAKLDFFSVTDHSNSFANEVYQSKHLSNADEFNDPGTFVALYGYEQTYNNATYYGHLNTLNYDALTTRSSKLRQYYDIMAKDENSIVMFNHPGYTWGNFCEYDFWSEEFDKVVNLSEIKGKSYDGEYALSLTKGWHVSPLYNEDNHSANWGAAYEYCGYALAPALTRQNIVEAFQKNRTYTTTDQTLKIYYKINDEWMGSRLNNPDKLKVSIDLQTAKVMGLGLIELVAEDNVVVASMNVGRTKKYTWEFEIDPHYDYYYVRVSCDKTWCVTAPIWIENREELTITGLTQALVTNTVTNDEHRFTATVKNSASVPLTNAVATFYVAPTSGINITNFTPSATVKIDKIAAGETIEVFADLPYNIAKNRIYVIVTAEAGNQKYGAVKYTDISNIYFTEIVAKSSKGSAQRDYEFIELYNNSGKTVNLFDYSIRYYAKPGAKADSLAENTWKLSGTIAPHSTVVLWFVAPDNKLSIADFNKKYGTSLVGGKDIIMIVGNHIPDTNPVQLEILNGNTVISRCWYNWEGALDVMPDKAVVFEYPQNYTFTATVSKKRAVPTPGKLVDGQMPEQIKK